jgi:hypothetical protein
MPRNPKFNALLQRMAEVHDRKAHDYAKDANPYSNFEFAGLLGSMFCDPTDVAFAVLIGVKIARLSELKRTGKEPCNESVADSHLDLANYTAIWASYKAAPEADPTPTK